MNSIKRQQGDILVGTLISLVILIIVTLMLAQAAKQWQYEQTAAVAVNRITVVQDAMQRGYINAITQGVAPNNIAAYPASRANLIALDLIEACSIGQEIAGQCIDQTKLPWVTMTNADQLMTITPFIDPSDNYPAFNITFSIANIAPMKKRMIIRNAISQLPNYTEDAAGNVTIAFTRPGSSVAQDNLVRRDGTAPMTADWDYGNFDLNNVKYINNVDDISFKNITDRTALTGSIKLGSVVISNSSGVLVAKPACPSGYTAQIQVWTVSLGTTDLQYNVKNFASWDVDSGNHWRIYFRSTAENSSGNKSYFYQGVVAYGTWCDF
ncbi:hypothetical protein VTH8203_00840 [Vibrio thalassae]|uniref:Uncharacterized protein n=1 Tax=Vibrio thalassae TaxID=1243014 RepID=A0A240EGD0_9VIBR|nr:hypothetical protein [Vibrio thalassae]SNX47239.1 hypothetical protein VTH8203_00840 [Vibrio thalassae]